MTTLMRNGRDRRLGKPVKGHAILERALLVGTRSADHIRASGHCGCIAMEVSPPFENRPYTWLHPNASQIRQIPPCTAGAVHTWPLTSFTAPQKCGRYRINSGQTAPSGLTGSAAFDPQSTCRVALTVQRSSRAAQARLAISAAEASRVMSTMTIAPPATFDFCNTIGQEKIFSRSRARC